jgi:hypothetical protein
MKYIIIGAIALFAMACGGPKEDSASLKEAKEVHNRMVGVASEMKDIIALKLQEHESKWAPIAAKGDTLLAAGDSLLASKLALLSNKLKSVQDGLAAWESSLVALPGEEHAHDHAHEGHDHAHDHSHAASPELTDDQLLELHKEQEAQLMALRDSLNAIDFNMISDSLNVEQTTPQP